jgi:hypothetical protein
MLHYAGVELFSMTCASLSWRWAALTDFGDMLGYLGYLVPT